MDEKLNWDAAQRVIEEDSGLMNQFILTDKSLAITARIKKVFTDFVRYNPRIYKRYLEIKKEVEDVEATE